MRDFKKFVAKKVIRSLETESIESRQEFILKHMEFRGNISDRVEKYRFWTDGFHPIEIHTPKFFEQKLHYIHQNPVVAMIVEEEEHYLFSSARDYAGIKGLVKIGLY
jgi:putative transposase